MGSIINVGVEIKNEDKTVCKKLHFSKMSETERKKRSIILPNLVC